MANVMSLKHLRNKPSRNGFDLSRKNIYSAKVGELLPVACIECIPGDMFKINVKNLTRTMPINTAAYTRIREYFDFFFVPTELMWHKYNTWVSQMVDNNQHATSVSENVVLTDRQPYMSFNALLNAIELATSVKNYKNNPLGYSRLAQAVKLLNYLNYGQMTVTDDNGTLKIGNVPANDVAINPFPLMAYQKIYADYYRNSQWENSYAPSFNCDYIKGNTDLELPIGSATSDYGQMYDLRYCNWNKDLFMGILPSSQFGDAASVFIQSPEIAESFKGDGALAFINSGSTVAGEAVKLGNQAYYSPSSAIVTGAQSNTILRPYLSKEDVNKLRRQLGLDSNAANFTILALRQAEALQKWQEITQSQQKDYKSQMEAHFGVKLSDAYSDRCQFIDGVVNTIDINEVVNNNITGSNAAEIAGKGIGVGDGNVSFSTDVHGYFMCIYHAVPLLDYAVSGFDKHNLKTYVTDYAIPELDHVGMQEIPWIELTTQISTSDPNQYVSSLGYAPRYYDYKTAIDRVHGAFVHGGLDAWVAPLTDSYMKYILDNSTGRGGYAVGYKYFKVNPNILDPVFALNAGDFVDSDQLLVNCSFDIKAVRNLDYNGLPY